MFKKLSAVLSTLCIVQACILSVAAKTNSSTTPNSESASADYLTPYNILWTTQSENVAGSMPLGGGDIGCNVWVENNEVLFYLSQSGTFDENNSMLKLGRVRLSLTPNPFNSPQFAQELKLRQGCVEIRGDHNTQVRLWVEVEQPVVHVEVSADVKTSAQVTFEHWRIADKELTTDERHQCFGYSNTTPEQFAVITRHDTIVPNKQYVTWAHVNRSDELITDREAVQQHLGPFVDRLYDPLKNLVFGGRLLARHMKLKRVVDGTYQVTPYRGWVYESTGKAKRHEFDIVLHTAHAPSFQVWQQSLDSIAQLSANSSAKWARHCDWWNAFWNRSYICVSPRDKSDRGWEVGRNYNLFRYQLACNAYGSWPSKFNGSLFTFDPNLIREQYAMGTPDFRRWGGGSFTAQNQRLVYWPMLKSGDFDLMPSQFDFYRRALGNAELRTRLYWGHEGASFTEQLNNNGLPAGHPYERLWGGTHLPIQPRSDASSTRVLVNQAGDTLRFVDYGWITNKWVCDHYDGQLEFVKMILDYHDYCGADISAYMPFIASSIRFYDEHYQYWSRRLNGYPLDSLGKLIIYPSAAMETYKQATNPVNTIAGLKSVLTQLLSMPECGTAAQQSYWRAYLDRLPAMPERTMQGHRTVAPCQLWDGKVVNNEVPQLYPVFPYRLYGVGRPDLDLYRDTWHYGVDTKSQYAAKYSTWHPDAIYTACLGLTSEAKKNVIMKLADSDLFRFPTFWGTADWAPDFNWGGVGMIALQEMLMQTVGQTIYLLPAWPADWNASFKLHAPGNTVIEAEVVDGKIRNLQVWPESRRQDVIIYDGHTK